MEVIKVSWAFDFPLSHSSHLLHTSILQFPYFNCFVFWLGPVVWCKFDISRVSFRYIPKLTSRFLLHVYMKGNAKWALWVIGARSRIEVKLKRWRRRYENCNKMWNRRFVFWKIWYWSKWLYFFLIRETEKY